MQEFSLVENCEMVYTEYIDNFNNPKRRSITMRRLLSSAALAAVFLCTPQFTPAKAADWDIDKYIAETNVVLGADGEGFCSGTIINIKRRIILTAAHCVKDRVERKEVEDVAPDGTVSKRTVERRLPFQIWQNVTKNFEVVETTRYLAKVKGVDNDADVAILQVVDEDYKPAAEAKLAPDNAPMRRGMDVYVIGNPGIELDNSVTKGILSAPERQIEFNGGGGPVKLFQIDAAVIGGNSGGQVVNDKGEIIGTVTGGLRGTTINFAAPVSQTKKLLINSGFRDVVDPKAGSLAESSNKMDDK